MFNEKSSDNVYNWQLAQVLQNDCTTILLISSFFFFSKSIVIWFVNKNYNFLSLCATLTKWASRTKLPPLWRNNGALPGRQWMRLPIPVFTGTLRHILRSWWGHSHTKKYTNWSNNVNVSCQLFSKVVFAPGGWAVKIFSELIAPSSGYLLLLRFEKTTLYCVY